MNVRWLQFGCCRRLFQTFRILLPFRELSDLVAGGTIVETSTDEDLVARTVIQLDGDIVTFVVPSALNETSIDRHFLNVDLRLCRITEQLICVVNAFKWIGLVILLFSFGCTLSEVVSNSRNSWDWILNITLGTLPGVLFISAGFTPVARKVFNKLVWFLINQNIRISTINAMFEVISRLEKESVGDNAERN